MGRRVSLSGLPVEELDTPMVERLAVEEWALGGVMCETPRDVSERDLPCLGNVQVGANFGSPSHCGRSIET